MRSRVKASVLAVFSAFALLVFFAPGAWAQFPQFQVSHFGADDDLGTAALFPELAFNTRTNQYLVVYQAGDTTGSETNWNIYAQRVDANGTPVGPPTQVNQPTSDPPNTNELSSFEPPSVAYGRKANEWMVAWDEGTPTTDENAIYAQRVDANGNLVGSNQQISDNGYDDIETDPIVYNSAADEFFVVWNAEAPGDTISLQNLFGQRLTSAGAQIGGDQQLTNFTNGSTSTADDAVGVAYDSKDQRYLAVVRGHDQGLIGNTHNEVFGHLMSTDGTTIGPDRFRISHVTVTNPGSGQTGSPSVAYDPINDRFIVGWFGNPDIGSMAPAEKEIFAQLVGSDGALLAPDDIRISHVGPDGDANFEPFRPSIVFNRFTGQYLFDWNGDNNTEGGVDEESEIWGQAVDASGNDIGASDFRISHDGPDGDTNFAAGRPNLAFNPVSCQNMTVWHTGSDANSFGGDEKENIFGNLLPATSCPRPTITQKGKAKVKKKGKKFLVKSNIKVSCPDIEDCTVTEKAKVKTKGKKITVSKAKTTVPLGKSQKLKFKLNKKGSNLLRERGKLKLKVKVTAKIGTGGPPVSATKKVKVKAPKK